MNGQEKKSSLVTRAFRTWKEFLSHEALSDPMAIILAQKQLVKTLTKVPKDKSKEAAKDMGMDMER